MIKQWQSSDVAWSTIADISLILTGAIVQIQQKIAISEHARRAQIVQERPANEHISNHEHYQKTHASVYVIHSHSSTLSASVNVQLWMRGCGGVCHLVMSCSTAISGAPPNMCHMHIVSGDHCAEISSPLSATAMQEHDCKKHYQAA
jgi:hypothetical protein